MEEFAVSQLLGKLRNKDPFADSIFNLLISLQSPYNVQSPVEAAKLIGKFISDIASNFV